ncbi:GNAT family N-acetyltransferase [uncultured Sphingomonas sp.]|uniref:GNAT family N-acetyltransferase n=1 Tax=uncultured Sphingomonas sp. TaxID=158754 RepID=UPI0035CAA3B1
MIETDRLVLSRPTLADLDDSVAMTGEASVMAFIGGKPLTREEAWNKLLRNIGHWDAFGYGLFTVRERAGGRFVGEIGLAHFARGFGAAFDPFPEGAWILARAGHGNGYASEAVAAAHDWMARTHGATRTVCIIDPANTASMRVAVKLGYVPFGEVEYRGGRPVMLGRG